MGVSPLDLKERGSLCAINTFIACNRGQVPTQPFNNFVRNIEMKSIDKFVLVLVASLALLLAGCGGGSSSMPEPEPEPPTAYEMALEDIMQATTAADAQAAYDAVKEQVNAAEGDKLQAAVNERTDELATAARAADQLEDLMMAAADVDTSSLMTAEDITEAGQAIAALQKALDDADDLSADQKEMYSSQLASANMAVAAAQEALDLRNDRTMQMTGLEEASDMLTTALGALTGVPTQGQIDNAQSALNMLNKALTDGADLTDAEKADYVTAAATAMGRIEGAKQALMAKMEADKKAEEMRIAEEKAAKEKEAAERAKDMAAMTAKLWAGLGTGPLANNGASTAISSSEGVLTVHRTGLNAGVALAENKDAMVASLHDWEGSEHTKKVANDGTYTARVYSNVGEPKQGAKFNSGSGADGVGFTLEKGVLTTGFDAGNASRVASPQFDHSAGNKEFELPDPNPGGLTKINIPGSYYGVAGTYTCVPGDNSACTATKASDGYSLGGGGGTWTFKPNNAEDRVTDMPDTMYAVYGWWLHEDAGGMATVSAFIGTRGTVTAASGIDALEGTATYKGGAAGKYAISAGTTNDSGHFTADAELTANFSKEKISGTINNFMGGDGMPRDWSVALKESGVSDAGMIHGADGSTGPAMKTTWTMGETAGADSGQWSGMLYDKNDGGVPSVGTGTFHSEYSNTGRMVGAFGVNLED